MPSTPNNSKHSILGEVLATALLAIEDGAQIASQPSILANPAVVAQIVSGFVSIWLATPAPSA